MKKFVAALFTVTLIALCVAVLTATPLTVFAAESVNFTVANDDPEFKWAYDEVEGVYSSTNKTDEGTGKSSSFSVIMETDGDLSFLYRTSSEDRKDKLIVASVVQGIKTTVNSFSGDMPEFLPLTVSGLSAGDEVVFTYSKNKSKDRYEDTVYIKDLRVISSLPSTVNVSAYTEGYGQIIYGGETADSWENLEVVYNSPVTLSAVAGEGYDFLGWKNDKGEVVCTASDYTETYLTNSALTAVFVPHGFSGVEKTEIGGTAQWVEDGGIYSLNGAVSGEAKLSFTFAGEGCVTFNAAFSSLENNGFCVRIDGIDRYICGNETPAYMIDADTVKGEWRSFSLWVLGEGTHTLEFVHMGTVSEVENVRLKELRFIQEPKTVDITLDYNASLGSLILDMSGVGATGYSAEIGAGKITVPLGVEVALKAEITDGESTDFSGYYVEGEKLITCSDTVYFIAEEGGITFSVLNGDGSVSQSFTAVYGLEARFSQSVVTPDTMVRTLFIGEAQEGVPVTVDGAVYVTDVNGNISLELPADCSKLSYYNPDIETENNAHELVLGDETYYELSWVAESVSLKKASEEDLIRICGADGSVVQDYKIYATVRYYSGYSKRIALTAQRAAEGDEYVFEAVLSTPELKPKLTATVREAPPSFADFISSVDLLRDKSADNFLFSALECRKRYLNLLHGRNADDTAFAKTYLAEYASEIGGIECVAEITSCVVYGDGVATVEVTRLDGSSYFAECEIPRKNYLYDEERDGVFVSAVCRAQYYDIAYNLITPLHSAERKEIELVILDQNSVYGDPIYTDQSAYTVKGLLESDDPLVEIYKEDGAAVGKYVLSGTVNNGFYTAKVTDGVFTVSRRPVTVKADDKTTFYGEATAFLTASVTDGSFVYGDVPDINLFTEATAKSDAGVYKIKGTVSNASSYSVTVVYGNYTVAPLPVTVEVGNQFSLYGDPAILDNTLYKAHGVISGDDLGVKLEKAEGRNAGEYAIFGEAINPNYSVTFVSGTYTVLPRPVTVTVNEATFAYGDKIALSYSTETFNAGRGLIAGDGLNINVTAEYGKEIGRYAVQCQDCDDNYAVEFTGAEEYEITARPILVTADNKQSVYGEEMQELTYSVENAIVGIDPGITLTKKEGVAVGEYAISGECANPVYRAYFTDGVYTVSPLPLTVTVNDVSRQYGDIANLNYTLSQSVLPYGDGEESVFAVDREEGESVGRYGVTARALGNPNYAVSFEYSDCAKERSVYEITPRAIEISIDGASAEITSDYSEIEESFSYRITHGATAFGETVDELGVKIFTVIDGAVVNAKNSNDLLKSGTFDICGDCENANYSVTFVKGKLTVSRICVGINNGYLNEALSGLTYTGENLLDDFDWEYEWQNVICGYGESAAESSFSIMFEDGQGNPLPTEINGRGEAVPQAVRAGRYTAEIKISDTDIYVFSTKFAKLQSRLFPFEIEKMDISDSLNLNALGGGKIVLGSSVRSIIDADSFKVTPVMHIQHDGKIVYNFYETGEYTVTAEVCDCDYSGEKTFRITVISSVKQEIAELNNLLNEYNLNGEAYAFEDMRTIISGFTADDKLQISAEPSYSAVVEKCNAAYAGFLDGVRQDAETAHSVTDSRLPEALGAYALLTVFAGVAFVALKMY